MTVVATGYSGSSTPRPMAEPMGEPRVARTSSREREREPVRSGSTQRTGLGVSQLDVPEFIPRR